MGIFDVVKDVAKVGAEILPIVLDNMAMGTQSKQTVPLGPIKVSVDGDQIYATNLGDEPKDVIFSVTNSTGGAMRNTNEIYHIEHGTSISTTQICSGCIQGWIGQCRKFREIPKCFKFICPQSWSKCTTDFSRLGCSDRW
jgi:hypothetical protein